MFSRRQVRLFYVDFDLHFIVYSIPITYIDIGARKGGQAGAFVLMF